MFYLLPCYFTFQILFFYLSNMISSWAIIVQLSWSHTGSVSPTISKNATYLLTKLAVTCNVHRSVEDEPHSMCYLMSWFVTSVVVICLGLIFFEMHCHCLQGVYNVKITTRKHDHGIIIDEDHVKKVQLVKYDERDPPGHSTWEQSPKLSAEVLDALKNTDNLSMQDPTRLEWIGSYKVCHAFYVTLMTMILPNQLYYIVIYCECFDWSHVFQ